MEEVWLYVYDLSEGTAQALCEALCGVPIVKGIWHSSLVLYNKEIHYGRKGIICKDFGLEKFTVVKKYKMGKTSVSLEDLLNYLSFLNHTKFQGENYNLIKFNCNVFANFLCNELVHKNIPEYLLTIVMDSTARALKALISKKKILI